MIWPLCSWTSQHRIPESQFPDTRMLAVGLHVRLLIPSFPACATLWSFGAIELGRVGAGGDIPNVDMIDDDDDSLFRLQVMNETRCDAMQQGEGGQLCLSQSLP